MVGSLAPAPSMKLIEEFMKFADPFATMLTRDPGFTAEWLCCMMCFLRTFWVTNRTRYFVSQLGLTANTLRNHLLIFRPSMVLYGQIVSGKHGQQLGGKAYGVAKEQTAD